MNGSRDLVQTRRAVFVVWSHDGTRRPLGICVVCRRMCVCPHSICRPAKHCKLYIWCLALSRGRPNNYRCCDVEVSIRKVDNNQQSCGCEGRRYKKVGPGDDASETVSSQLKCYIIICPLRSPLYDIVGVRSSRDICGCNLSFVHFRCAISLWSSGYCVIEYSELIQG